jgi:O-antigen/teichoic acid export membrane protein
MGWAFAGRIFSLIISFFIGAFVARYLGPQRYGVLNYAISFVTLFVFLSSFGIDNIIVRELLKYKEKQTQILNTAFVLKIIGAFLIIIVSLFFSFILKNDPYITLLIFIYSTHLIVLSLNVTDSYFQATLKYKYSFFAQFISTIAVSLLKLYFVYKKFDVGWFVLALVFETAVSSFVLIKLFYKNGSFLSFKPNLKLSKEMISDSWPFILTSAFYLIYTKIDQVMIGKMIDTKSLGIYSAGVKLAELWFFIPSIICGVMFPAVINAKLIDKILYKQRLKKIFISVISISLLFAAFQIITAKYLVIFIFGQDYLGSIIILKIYTWSGIIVSSIIILQQYLIIENKTKLIMASSLVGAITNILLNLILIPKFNIIGSAWATIISYSIIPLIILVSLKISKKNNE